MTKQLQNSRELQIRILKVTFLTQSWGERGWIRASIVKKLSIFNFAQYQSKLMHQYLCLCDYVDWKASSISFEKKRLKLEVCSFFFSRLSERSDEIEKSEIRLVYMKMRSDGCCMLPLFISKILIFNALCIYSLSFISMN